MRRFLSLPIQTRGMPSGMVMREPLRIARSFSSFCESTIPWEQVNAKYPPLRSCAMRKSESTASRIPVQEMPTPPSETREESGGSTEGLRLGGIDGRRSGQGLRRARADLLLDPRVGALEALHERRGWRPAELLADQPVVGVAAAHAHGTLDVDDVELLARDRDHDAGELVDRHHFLGADVDGPFPAGAQEPRGRL